VFSRSPPKLFGCLKYKTNSYKVKLYRLNYDFAKFRLLIGYNARMIGKDAISILITFIFGFFAGGYLYLTGFATNFELPDAPTENAYEEFVIEAKEYGQCQKDNTCLSFQMLDDGDYRSIIGTTEEGTVREGAVPRSMRKQLSEELIKKKLVDLIEVRIDSNCQSNSEATNFIYQVTIDGVEYQLDTCSKDFSEKKAPWTSLVNLSRYTASS
jgi:hypothetical protein